MSVYFLLLLYQFGVNLQNATVGLGALEPLLNLLLHRRNLELIFKRPQVTVHVVAQAVLGGEVARSSTGQGGSIKGQDDEINRATFHFILSALDGRKSRVFIPHVVKRSRYLTFCFKTTESSSLY